MQLHYSLPSLPPPKSSDPQTPTPRVKKSTPLQFPPRFQNPSNLLAPQSFLAPESKVFATTVPALVPAGTWPPTARKLVQKFTKKSSAIQSMIREMASTDTWFQRVPSDPCGLLREHEGGAEAQEGVATLSLHSHSKLRCRDAPNYHGMVWTGIYEYTTAWYKRV